MAQSESSISREYESFESLAKLFAQKTVSRMFDGLSPDGSMLMLEEIIGTAFSTGIAASWAEGSAGREYGVWGSHTDTAGILPSALMLSAIAEKCGGIAMLFNIQGAASNILMQCENPLRFPGKRAALCIQEGPYPLTFSELNKPSELSLARPFTRAVKRGNEYIINGFKSFVYAMPRTDIYIVMALTDEGWGFFAIQSDADGISAEDAGPRTGLRACSLTNVKLSNTAVPLSARIDNGNGRSLAFRALGLLWAGMAAISAGIAAGACSAAHSYSAERYQGCRLIEDHPAVRALLSGADAGTEMISGSIRGFSISPENSAFIKRAAELKLLSTTLAFNAVTDSLQVLGGCGYMEDFGMEKRLRDIAVLRSAMGSPVFLKQFIFEAGRGD